MKRSEAIKNLLTNRTHRDLADLYNDSMEVQVNVAQDNGIRIDGDYKGRQWHGWTDGNETWKPFRIPHNARTEPIDNDSIINYNLAAHVEGVGMTGWDWKHKVSRWVGFDFDAIIGHSDTHEKKLSEPELKKIRDIVSEIPWVTVRSSTGGRGLHLYVFLKPVIYTNNHIEHAAIARAVIGLMSALTGFDFKSKVDTCGGNLWCWHKKMIGGTNGLSLIKQGLPLDQVPTNWRDHINVVSGKSKKIVPSFIKDKDDIEKLFDELTSQKTKIPLDEGHQKLIKFLHDNHLHSWFDQDLHMLVTHTHHLKRAHEELSFKGIFKTISPATDLDTQNAFAFPLRRGAWAVRRYTPGIVEDMTWMQDANGFTKCFLNKEPDLHVAARSYDGIEHKSGGYIFREAEIALKSVEMLGVKATLPAWAQTRKTKVKEMKDGRLLIEVTHDSNDRADDMPGWLAEKGNWTKIFNRNVVGINEPEAGNYDDVIRHLITETGDDYGWLLKSNAQWRTEPLVHVKTFLKSLNLKSLEVETILGSCIAKPWRLVCKPFEPEILGDRDWNRKAPQLAYVPTNTDILSYPSWLKILNHLGKGLNSAIAANQWAKNNGILTGADYLKCWLASLLKEPRQPLPYLFFYGPQNSGKSIFHEAISLLVTSGIVRADHALMNQSGFNGELENAILAVIEETDLRKSTHAYNRIKDWVTSIKLTIRHLYQSPYSIHNTVHFVQMANEPGACPIFPGDARIVVIEVQSLENLIPKKQLLIDLQKEAPDFLASVLAIELPESGDRLNLPVISTQAKQLAQEGNKSYLEIFFDEECHYWPGKAMKLSELYDRFLEWAEPNEIHNWGKTKFGREIPSRFPKGRFPNNQVMIGNISFVKPQEAELNEKKYILAGDKLTHE